MACLRFFSGGDHTRTKVLVTSKVGALANFTQKRATCISCKTLLKSGDDALCQYCLPKQAEIYLKEVSTLSELEVKYNRLWTQCQRCQGSLHEDILCTRSEIHSTTTILGTLQVDKDLSCVVVCLSAMQCLIEGFYLCRLQPGLPNLLHA
jgi:hypothetical protein